VQEGRKQNASQSHLSAGYKAEAIEAVLQQHLVYKF
jgi:hypothetical protein